MPAEDYYCADNFFKKMTDLDSPRKNNDCYFYYYSTCAKGDSCTFRHEPSALGCETMCSFWKEGKCLNVHCNFRHMELRKNRKVIPCYWETQPGGCLKPHCPFMHQNAVGKIVSGSAVLGQTTTDNNTEKHTSDTMANEKLNQSSDTNFKPAAAVDSIVVNFEEESDNESVPTNSPAKMLQRTVRVKTLEEIKLEKIQAESAAYYSYPELPDAMAFDENADDLRKRIIRRIQNKHTFTRKNPTGPAKRLLTTTSSSLNEPSKKMRKQANQNEEKKETKDISGIKIKTLAEIRAERMVKFDQKEPDSQTSDVKPLTEAEDKSNNPLEIQDKRSVSLKRKLSPVKSENIKKIIRLKAPAISANEVSSTIRDEEAQNDGNYSSGASVSKSQKKVKLIRKPAEETMSTVETESVNTSPRDFKDKQEESEDILKLDDEDEFCDQDLEGKLEGPVEAFETPMIVPASFAPAVGEIDAEISELNNQDEDSLSDNNSKILDETLLLEDDDEVLSGSVQEEDELLDQIDNLLGE